MRKFLWPIIILLLSIVIWLAPIKFSPLIAKLLIEASNECSHQTISECQGILSALGAAGDVFGSITSLFSGLALFAVSYTLWSDTNARRESRKPLVINYLDDTSIVIKNPQIKDKPKIELSVTSRISNKNGEAALNVAVRCQIKSELKLFKEFQAHLSQPLVSEGTEDLNETVTISGSELKEFLAMLTEDENPVLFIFEIGYNSLENIRWETKVTYNVTCKEGARTRLNSVRSGTDDFEDLWGNGAQVPLEVKVKEGSWIHQRK